MTRCMVPCCQVRLSKLSKRKRSFYKFPRNNEELLEKWKAAIFSETEKNPEILKSSAVCSIHFRKIDYVCPYKIKKKLKKSAVPSMYLTMNDELDYLPIEDNEIEPTEYFDDDSDSNPFPTLNDYSTVDVYEDEAPPVLVYDLGPLCDVPTCRKGALDKVTLFNAPKSNKGKVSFKNKDGTVEIVDKRTAWLKLAHIVDEIEDDETKVWKFCSAHFLPKDFRPGPKTRLTNLALPSQNLTAKAPEEDVNNGQEENSADDTEMADNPMEEESAPTLEYESSDTPAEVAMNVMLVTTNDIPSLETSAQTELCLLDKMDCATVEVVTENLEEKAKNDVCPVRELCRVCAGNSGVMVEIFNNKKLLENIRRYLPIKVHENDELPIQVCEGCVKWLESCHQLIETCTNADTELRRRLALEQMPPETAMDCNAPDSETQNFDPDDQNLESPEKIIPPISESNDITRKEAQKYVRKSRRREFTCKICAFQSKNASEFDVHMFSHIIFWCRKCDLNFKTETDLKVHRETHKISCQYCSVKYIKEQYRAHLKKVHSIEPTFLKIPKDAHEPGTCTICNFTYSQKFTVKRHYFWEHFKHACDLCLQLFDDLQEQVQHTEEVHMIPCPYCPEKNYGHHRFKRHVNKEHYQIQNLQEGNIPKSTQQIYECNFCRKGLTSKAFVKRHNYWSHFSYTCIICLETFKTVDLEEKHFKSHGNICICCEETFSTPVILLDHIKSQHPEFKPFTCENCGNSFDTRIELNSHRSVHELPENFLCEKCGKGFKTRNVLTQHKYTHKSVEEKGKVECTYCRRKFVFKSQMKTHLLTHTGNKKVKCKNCKKSFINDYALIEHVKSYNCSRKKYKCDNCKLLFCSKNACRKHIESIHSVNSDYKCSICAKMFSSKRDIELHVSFHSNSELSQWEESYTKISTFSCEICSKKFAHKNLLKTHLKIHLKQGMMKKSSKLVIKVKN